MNYVIIGTGAAGIMAAKEIRKLKKDAQITMISADEQDHPESRERGGDHHDLHGPTGTFPLYAAQISFPRKDGGRVVVCGRRLF